MVAGIVAILSSQSFAAMWYITLPDFRGKTPAEATKALRDKGYDAKTVEVPADNYTLVGKVVRQDPKPNTYTFTEKPKNFVVTLYVGSREGLVPDTLLMTEAAAVDALKKAGYVPKVEYYVNQTQGMAGKVWKTEPGPHRNLAKGGTVVLQVAKPGQAMENFIGKHSAGVPQWTAEINRIKGLGIKSTVIPDKTTSVPQEDQKVYAQTPAPGAVLVQGSEIKVSAYKYVPPPPPPPKPTPMSIMPNVVGKSEKEAKEALFKIGKSVSIVYAAAPQQNQGRVIAQSIAAGQRTAGGSVTITVGSK